MFRTSSPEISAQRTGFTFCLELRMSRHLQTYTILLNFFTNKKPPIVKFESVICDKPTATKHQHHQQQQQQKQ